MIINDRTIWVPSTVAKDGVGHFEIFKEGNVLGVHDLIGDRLYLYGPNDSFGREHITSIVNHKQIREGLTTYKAMQKLTEFVELFRKMVNA